MSSHKWCSTCWESSSAFSHKMSPMTFLVVWSWVDTFLRVLTCLVDRTQVSLSLSCRLFLLLCGRGWSWSSPWPCDCNSVGRTSTPFAQCLDKAVPWWMKKGIMPATTYSAEGRRSCDPGPAEVPGDWAENKLHNRSLADNPWWLQSCKATWKQPTLKIYARVVAGTEVGTVVQELGVPAQCRVQPLHQSIGVGSSGGVGPWGNHMGICLKEAMEARCHAGMQYIPPYLAGWLNTFLGGAPWPTGPELAQLPAAQSAES